LRRPQLASQGLYRFNGSLIVGEAVQVLEHFMDKSAEVCLPCWWLFDVVKPIQFELLWAIKEKTNG
jgi:hypothetical protein